MSATEGVQGKDKHYVDSSFDGTKHLLSQDFIPTNDSRLTFHGKNGTKVQFPYLSWGSWSWGDTASWDWSDDELPALREAWDLAVKSNMAWIDNAQAYGSGESERIMGDLLKGLPRDSYQIQSKWYVVPNNPTNLLHPVAAPAKMLKETLERCKLDYIDCYLVHGHIHASSIKQVAQGLAEYVNSGMTKTVGVANYSAHDMIEMADALAKYDIPLATNQCEYNALRRYPETGEQDLLSVCKERGIVFQSYSSLAQGRLSGKYGPNNPAPKNHRFSSYPAEEIEPTLDVLRAIGEERKKPVSAVALNYNISKGVIPVVGMRKPSHVRENLEALGWRLTVEEVKRLDAVSLEGKTTKLWQQG